MRWRLSKAARLAPVLVAAASLAPIGLYASSANASPSPRVSIAPSRNYHNNQSVTVSLAPNALYRSPAGLALHVVECADPGGLVSKLPTRFYECDADTSTRVVTKPNGSFSSSFLVYVTPLQLEPKDSLPRCNATHYCVLMVSSDIADLAGQHLFSAPFLVGARTAPRLARLDVDHANANKSSSSASGWIALGAGIIVVVAGLGFGLQRARIRA